MWVGRYRANGIVKWITIALEAGCLDGGWFKGGGMSGLHKLILLLQQGAKIGVEDEWQVIYTYSTLSRVGRWGLVGRGGIVALAAGWLDGTNI